MAKNIIGGIEYESEPHPSFRIDGKPVYYAKNVPELLRGLTEENCGFAMNDPQFEAFDELVRKYPLDAAKKGAKAWNRWVQWAQLQDSRWLQPTWTSAGLLLRIRSSNQNLEIRFGKRHGLPDLTSYPVSIGSFQNFVFPNAIEFRHMSFQNKVSFNNATFMGSVICKKCEFEKGATFSDSRFSGFALFSGSMFGDATWFSRAEFENTSDFNDTTFVGPVYFGSATFCKKSEFSRTVFLGIVSFDWAVFESALFFEFAVQLGGAYFDHCRFSANVDFSGSQFLAFADFSSTSFGAFVNFDHSWFGKTATTPLPDSYASWTTETQETYDLAAVSTDSKTIPDFRGTQFEVAPNLGYTHVQRPPEPEAEQLFLRRMTDGNSARIDDADAASKLRRLAELAHQGHHHLAEKRFFRAELLCRRGHETRNWREVAMINAFEAFSKCGLSFWRPIGCWAATSLLFGMFYWLSSARFGVGGFLTDLVHLANYTLANALPIVGVFSSGNSKAVIALYGEAAGVPFHVGLLAGVHNLLSTVFLFFALLAIRNYFKLG